MDPEFEIIDISATGASANDVWLAAVSRLGAVHGVPRSLVKPGAVGLTDQIERFRQCVRTGLRHPGFVAETASFLTGLLFGVPEINVLFQRTRGAAAESGRPVLLRLMATPHSIASLPWELLLDPEQGPHRYLTLAPDVHIVRLARARTYLVRTAPIPPPLKMLLILSSPLGDGSSSGELMFDLYEEKRALLQDLAPLVRRGLIEIDVEDRPTIANLRARIARERRGYNIVHYVGHGRPETLTVEDERGRSTLIEADKFNALLRACRDLRLIIFSACQSAEPPEDSGVEGTDVRSNEQSGPDGSVQCQLGPTLLSLADRCVRDVCPVVVGMQAVLPFPTERLFARYFYQGLAAGRTIPDAVTLARAAIYDDRISGQGLLDWAVPTLFVGGELPSRIIDPEIDPATIAPGRRRVSRPRREELRLDLVEGDREFFARYVELRQTVDFLAGRMKARCLWVVGPRGVGKTRLVGRALFDVDEMVDYVLYVPLGRLLAGNPVQNLCAWVTELLGRRPDPPTIDPELPDEQRWERIIDAIVERPIAIVIDDLSHLRGQSDSALHTAIQRLIARDTKARLLLVAENTDRALIGNSPDFLTATVRLNHLGWDEVWQWMRRNRPGLTQFDAPTLRKFFPELGPHLESWSSVAERVTDTAATEDNLAAIVTQIVADRRATQSVSFDDGYSTRPFTALDGIVPGKTGESAGRRTGLRVAVAGPFLDGRHAEFAAALTEVAYLHNVSGRVSADPIGDPLAPIATLLPIPSPFKGASSTLSEIMKWLDSAARYGANIILVDFGNSEYQGSEVYASVFGQLEDIGALILGVGSDDKRPVYPGWLPSVFAVGPLADGSIAAYSHWDAAKRKPDIFAPEHVRGTPLERAVSNPEAQGASHAALHVLAAAVLILAADPTLKPSEVRRVLLESADPIVGPEFKKNASRRSTKKPPGALSAGTESEGMAGPARDQPLRLNVDAAILQVRRRALLTVAADKTLAQELTSLQGLSAATGFTLQDISRLIENPASFRNAKDLAVVAATVARVAATVAKLVT
jgi:hypothetical protein